MPTNRDDTIGSMRKLIANVPMMGPRQMALMAESHIRLFKQIEDVNKVWTESVQRTKESETEFARRLIDCADPAKAAELCVEWMTARARSFLADSQSFSSLWLSFCSYAGKAIENSVAVETDTSQETAAKDRSSES